jgi:hypothetical protein
MQYSKEFLVKHSIYPKISFKDKLPHTFKLLKDKIDTISGDDGKAKEGVTYKVLENGEEKTFFTTSPSLIAALSSHEPNDTVTVKLVSKNINGKLVSVYVVNSEAEVAAEDEQDGLGVEEIAKLMGAG